MASGKLYSRHSMALAAEYANIETFAAEVQEAFEGTAGGVSQQRRGDRAYHVWKWRDWSSRQRLSYIGPVGDEIADESAAALRERVAEMQTVVPSLRMLRREGYATVDAKSYATIAVLHNHGIFAAGGILIGSHAYGAMLNKTGVRTSIARTDDIDIARASALAFKRAPGKSLLEMLRESGVNFVEIPQLKHKQPPTSYKEVGRATFRVDLLVPAFDETFPIIEVPELKAHATGLPYLGYLLAETQPAAIIAKTGCLSVRIPVPERFAVHKLVVSQLRSRSEKVAKDRHQAAVLASAMADEDPGAIADAVGAMSKRMARHFRNALPAVRGLLEGTDAWRELTD